MALTTKTIIGHYAANEGGGNADGSVVFEQVYQLLDQVSNTVYGPFTREVTLVSGSFSTALPINNQLGITPQGWAYKVTEKIAGRDEYMYFILVTSTLASSTDITDLSPLTQPVTPESFVTLGQFQIATEAIGDPVSHTELANEATARENADTAEAITRENADNDLQYQIDGFDPAVMLDDLTDVTITSPSVGDVLKWNGSGWVNGTDETGGGGGGGGTSAAGVVRHTGGDYPIATTDTHALSFFADGTEDSFDLVVPAQVGDIIEMTLNFLMNSASQSHGFDVATIIGGSVVNWFGAGLTDALASADGLGGWFKTTGIEGVSGSAFYEVQSGDIDGSGNVTVRAMHAGTGTSGTFYWDAITAMVIGVQVLPGA